MEVPIQEHQGCPEPLEPQVHPNTQGPQVPPMPQALFCKGDMTNVELLP